MAEIALHGVRARGRVALVDDADLDLVAAYRWRVLEQVRSNGTTVGPYATATIPTGKRGGRKVLMHTLILGAKRIDHANGDGLDNQRGNLRPCTQSQNMANRAGNRSASSRFKGVCWHSPSRLWSARIKKDGKVTGLGYFRDEADAVRAYDVAATALFGEFARFNFGAVG